MFGVTGPISDLDELIASMRPELSEPEYVFCRVEADRRAQVLAAKPLSTFWESEGLSVVIERNEAQRLRLDYDSVHRCITLQVHSSLSAVGLTAAVAEALAKANLSANVVAAYTHDHVFVPTDRASEALEILRALSARGSQSSTNIASASASEMHSRSPSKA